MVAYSPKDLRCYSYCIFLGEKKKKSVLRDTGRIVMLQEYKMVLFCRPVSLPFVTVFLKCAGKYNVLFS